VSDIFAIRCVIRAVIREEDEGMKIETALLADSAQVANGKLFILGGGWSLYRSGVYPVAIQMAVAFLMSFNSGEVGSNYPMVVTIADEAGVPIAPSVQGQLQVGPPPPEVPQGSAIKIPIVANIMTLQIPRAGKYAIDIRVGTSRAQLQFDAIFVGTKVELNFPSATGGEVGN
jgi:Family of unknown function (DUF6941)